MDLYSSDLRLSDIGLDPQEREMLAQEYPLGMLDEEEGDSGIYNPYSPGSSTGYEDSGSNTDILTDIALHRQVIDERGALMDMDDSATAVDGILDVLNTTGTNLHWIDSFLQSTHSNHDDETSMLNDEDLLASAAAGILRKQPRVKNEHSYSLARAGGETSGPLDLSLIGLDVKLEDETGDVLEHDIDVEGDTNGLLFGSLVDDDSDANMSLLVETTPTYQPASQSVSVRCMTSLDDLYDVKPDGRDLLDDEHLIEYVKEEPEEESCGSTADVYQSVRTSSEQSDVYGTSIMLHLPPTPPPSSGCSSSDSESCHSPTRSPATSPTQQLAPSSSAATLATKQLAVRHNQNLWTATIHQPTGLTSTYSSNNTNNSQALQGGMVGCLFLTEEEKRTMIAEGYPLPAKLPLTKQEEKNLKKIRRKIKNKISAQESRRKKKEYLETLEKKVDNVNQENNHLKKKVDILETNNRSLISQLQRLQAIVNKLSPVTAQSNTAATTTCVLVN